MTQQGGQHRQAPSCRAERRRKQHQRRPAGDDALGKRLTQGQQSFAVGLPEPADGDTGALCNNGSDILPGQTHSALGAAGRKLAAHKRAQFVSKLCRLLILCVRHGLLEPLLQLLLALGVLRRSSPAEPDARRTLVEQIQCLVRQKAVG